MRRPLVVLGLAVAAIALFAGGLAWLLDTPPPPPGAGRARKLYDGLCAGCHGADGRGSWRATLFLIRPGDLSDPTRMRGHTDRYLFDIIKHGGAPVGRPGMPAFFHLSDADVGALVAYLRKLAGGGEGRPAGS
jgi:mono/diheme cytochrome c family protein